MEKTQEAFLDKLNELLSLRSAKLDNLKQLNSAIKNGMELIEGFPRRWYVRNPSMEVFKYLENKYDRRLSRTNEPVCGYGELHGELAFVPHDVDYPWEITQTEFDQILKKVTAAGEPLGE